MPNKRVLIVGGVAGGASCAARLRRMDENAEIFIFERSGNVSFANCGLPYYLGGVIADRRKLLIATPERFRDFFRIEVRTWHEVGRIDPAARTIEVKNLQTGAVRTEPYNALVLATGAAPLRPPLAGIELPGIFALRDLDDVGPDPRLDRPSLGPPGGDRGRRLHRPGNGREPHAAGHDRYALGNGRPGHAAGRSRDGRPDRRGAPPAGRRSAVGRRRGGLRAGRRRDDHRARPRAANGCRPKS